MKRITLAILFSLFATNSYSQGMYGLLAGVGFTTSYKSYYTPAFEAFYLKKFSYTVYAGGSISFQRYSFFYDAGKSNPSYGDVMNIRQKSDFVFFSPKLDIGIGYRKYVHLNFSLGPGVYAGGDKETTTYQPFYMHTGPNSGSDTVTTNTTSSIRNIIFHYGFGVTERIPVGFWNIILSQEFSYITSHLNYPGTNLNTSYVSVSVGLMHKYPQVLVEY